MHGDDENSDPKRKNRLTCWDCANFDTARVGSSFPTLASTAIGDDDKLQQFHSRYFLPPNGPCSPLTDPGVDDDATVMTIVR